MRTLVRDARDAAGSARIWERVDSGVERLIAARTSRGTRDIELADALRVIAAAMRSGATVQQALVRAAERGSSPVARASAKAAARISLGCPVEEEIDAFAARIGTPAARLFAQVVHVQHRRGGDIGGPCHRLAALLHERTRLDAEARAATAQARFSARAVIAIPLLLAIIAIWRSPEAAAQLARPGPLLIAAPGFVLIAAGALVARRIASTACSVGDGGGTRGSSQPLLARAVRRCAGDGLLAVSSARLMAAGASICVALLVAAGATAGGLLCTVIVVLAAGAWPWMDRARGGRRRHAVAQAGIEPLLEVSIALFAAGATAHEVATLAPASAPEPLRSALAPAVHGVSLGRTIASAFDAVPELHASPQLDGWLHAVCTSAELGSGAIDVLEHLLRDARAARREQLRAIAQTAAPRMQLALVLLVVPGVMWLMLLATMGGLVRQLQAAGVA